MRGVGWGGDGGERGEDRVAQESCLTVQVRFKRFQLCACTFVMSKYFESVAGNILSERCATLYRWLTREEFIYWYTGVYDKSEEYAVATWEVIVRLTGDRYTRMRSGALRLLEVRVRCI